MPFQSRNTIYLWDEEGNHKTLTHIKIQTLPNNRILLIVHLSKFGKQRALENWELLKPKLEEQGWLKKQVKPEKPDLKTASKQDWLDYYHDMKQAGYSYNLKIFLSWFPLLFAHLRTAASLVWLASTGPGEKKRRLAAVALALVPSALLTAAYLQESGFFAAAVARRVARGLQGLEAGLPAVLHRELFAVYAEAWPIGLAGLLVAALWAALAWTGQRNREASGDLGPWKRPVGGLALGLLLALVLVPDHLGGQGGFLKARLAPVPFLLGLGLL